MQILTRRQGAFLCFWLSVLFVVVDFCYGDHSTVEVVGLGECADCKEKNIQTSQAFSGLRVTVDCKAASGNFERRGVGELDEYGNFKVSLPHDTVKDDKLIEECYAQLLSASAAPCPTHDGPLSHKIVIKSKTNNEKHTLGPAGKLKFSSQTCASASSG
uniref:Proline-rich protein n=1 Tax=Glycine max TaxID=3847 RepID=K7LNW2_SOYBN